MIKEYYDKKCYVYYNLHKHCWSVKALEGCFKGRVIAHLDELTISNPQFKVSQWGRERVLKEKSKNVHAGVVGYFKSSSVPKGSNLLTEVTYNPYKYSSFVKRADETNVYSDEYAFLTYGKVYIPEAYG